MIYIQHFCILNITMHECSLFQNLVANLLVLIQIVSVKNMQNVVDILLHEACLRGNNRNKICQKEKFRKSENFQSNGITHEKNKNMRQLHCKLKVQQLIKVVSVRQHVLVLAEAFDLTLHNDSKDIRVMVVYLQAL